MYSLIMPVYNGRQYFERALSSALTAIEHEDEIIVVEDGSTDGGVRRIVDRYASRTEISYISKSNGGVASALNAGLDKSRNPIFSWLSHDDLYLPNRLSSDRRLRQNLPDLVTMSNFYLYFEGTGKCVHVNATRKIGSRQTVKLLGSRFINGNCLSAPVRLLKSLGGFNETLRHTQDYDLWCRMLQGSTLTAITEATVVSRQHPNQDSRRAPAAARDEYKHLIRNYLNMSDVVDPRNAIEMIKVVKNALGH